jgi:hypothetical protein
MTRFAMWPKVSVLYLERPSRNSAQLHVLNGALLIQRLEGSRPYGSLCTLNRSALVRRDQEEAELGRMRLREGRVEGRSGWLRADLEAGETGIRGVLVDWDNESACAPKHGQRPRI